MPRKYTLLSRACLITGCVHSCSSLSVGLKTGYKLFPLTSLDQLEPSFEKGNHLYSSWCIVANTVCIDGSEVCIIERLFSSSLVALVEMSNPRKLRVCHFKVMHFVHLVLSLRGNAHVHHVG